MFDALRLKISQSIIPKDSVGRPYQLSLISPNSTGGTSPRLGTTELLKAYTEMPWLRALVNKVGKSVGSTHWTLLNVRESKNDRKSIRPYKLQRAPIELRRTLIKSYVKQERIGEIENHPLLDLLVRGNDHFLGQTVFQLVQMYLDLVGEAFLIKERNVLGTPVNLWPIPPDWIKEFPTTDNFSYKITIGAVQVDVPMTEIIAFIDPDPANPYGRGTGIAKSLGDELETDEYAAKHLKNFFFNRARPDIIISGDNLGTSDTKRLEERWLEKHRGFWNAFKPHFISRKIDITQLGQSFENMQMIEIRKHERDTVIQVYGVPPEKLGVVGESKRSTIAAADLFWTKDIITPRLEHIRMVLQEHLVRNFDDRLVLDYELPEVQDDEHRLEVMKAAPWAWSRNEWRETIGSDPDEERGDVYVQQLNLNEVPTKTPIDEVPSAPVEEPITIEDDSDSLDESLISEAVTDNLEKICDTVKERLLMKRRGI